MKLSFKYFIFILITIVISFYQISYGETKSNKELIKTHLKSYYTTYKNMEYFSGMGLAIGIKDGPIDSVYIGSETRHTNHPIDANAIFQIGSITKSYTAAIILKLVAKNKLKLTDMVSKYLPEYPKWGHLTIESLFNMSSGLPNYSDSATFNYIDTKNLAYHWGLKELIDIVYPKGDLNPPLMEGYYYTNTGYLLAELIIEKITKKTLGQLIKEEIIEPLDLDYTYYPLPNLSPEAKKYLVHGNGYNQYVNPELVGVDMPYNNLSWGAAAGAVISTAPDIIKWVRGLFLNDQFLNASQRKALTALISLKTGKPIITTSKDEPRGFGLGVIQGYNQQIGHFWYYEGQTLGFRAMYFYVPCNQVIVAATINSATNGENDHLHSLLVGVYQDLLKQNPKLQCQLQ